jgi:hypothetical protein
MKRFAIVAALAALTVVGCKKKEETPAATPATTEPAAKPTEGDKAAMPAAADPAAAPAAATDPAAAPAAAAPAGEDTTSGVAECDELTKRYTSCEKMPAESKAAFLEGAKAWKTQAATGDDKVKAAMADSCKKAAEAADAALKAQGC